jgi:hypothetical protein
MQPFIALISRIIVLAYSAGDSRPKAGRRGKRPRIDASGRPCNTTNRYVGQLNRMLLEVGQPLCPSKRLLPVRRVA